MTRQSRFIRVAAIALAFSICLPTIAQTSFEKPQSPSPTPTPPIMISPAGARLVEQTSQGPRASAVIVANFDGLGVGFKGSQGTAILRNPSDNSLAVGPNHIFQIVNTRMAIFTKKGKQFDTTGKALYGPVPTNTIFKGFGGACEATNNGDAVVRYDQLADRWLVVMPIFRRLAPKENEPTSRGSALEAQRSPAGVKGQPGAATPLSQPTSAPAAAVGARGPGRGSGRGPGGG